MLYVPPISDYQPFYVQLASGTAKNIMTDYKVVIKTHDYPAAFKVKEPYKNQWKDEHGDDEYIGSSGLYLEAFTMKLECAMFASNSTLAGAIDDLKAGVRVFQNALLGGFFKTYDSWTGYGFQNVRLVEFPMPAQDAYRAWDETRPTNPSSTKDYKARVIFTVTIKINDPKTLMKLQDGSIVAA